VPLLGSAGEIQAIRQHQEIFQPGSIHIRSDCHAVHALNDDQGALARADARRHLPSIPRKDKRNGLFRLFRADPA
jgi:hypothetical protein